MLLILASAVGFCAASVTEATAAVDDGDAVMGDADAVLGDASAVMGEADGVKTAVVDKFPDTGGSAIIVVSPSIVIAVPGSLPVLKITFAPWAVTMLPTPLLKLAVMPLVPQ